MTFAILLIQLALAQSPARPLLDVPFVAQTPQLCGGAAVSMVMRYWGQRDVFPEDFAPLVSASDGGIFTGVLAKAVRDRGWMSLVDPATGGTERARVSAEIDRGRPVIALIQVTPGTYHYVVIVAATSTEVVFHDPARGPFRVMDWMRFNLAWSQAGHWMMVPLPPAGFTALKQGAETVANPAAAVATVTTPCSALVAHAVETALAGQLENAEQELAAAMRICPADPAAWREMAGLRFSQKRYAEANTLATTAAKLAPSEKYSWDLAATSRFLSGDAAGALSAWNRIGQPNVDAVNVHGAERTHLPVVVRASGIEPRMLLTPDAFVRALRRLRDLPAVSTAAMKFEPAGDRADVEISIVERSPWPKGRQGLLMLAARLPRELRVDLAGLSGAGESAFASWRFADKRERFGVGLAFPSPRWLPGIATFSGLWEEQHYAAAVPEGELLRETRRRAGLQLSDWPTGWLKWKAGAGFDRFGSAGHVAIDGSLMARTNDDRAAVIVSSSSWFPLASGSGWFPLDEGPRFSTGGLRVALRSTADRRHPMLSAVAELQRAASASPLALWPGAGTGAGSDRGSLLRGHRLVDDGVVNGDLLGRRLLNGSIEYSHPVRDFHSITLTAAAFIDAARASLGRGGLAPTPVFVDAGAGIRLLLPGSIGGLRLDVGHRLGAGRTVVSVGWMASWPQ